MKKTANLIIKNNLTVKRNPLCQAGVAYCFSCPMPNCKSVSYIGMTQTTLSRRLTYHAQSGSIFLHFKSEHCRKPKREELCNNTVILSSANSRQRLAIKEAILISEKNPTLNRQYDNFNNILKLGNRSHTTTLPTQNLKPNNTPSDTPIDALSNPILTLENPIPPKQSLAYKDKLNPVPTPAPVENQPNLVPIPSINLVSEPPNETHIPNLRPRNKSHPIPNLTQINTEVPPIHGLNPNPENNLSTLDFPDMMSVLLRFGIVLEKLTELPLDDYCKKYSLDPEVEDNVDSTNDMCIARRVRGLNRKARHSTHLSQQEN